VASVKIKICGITTVSDALAAAELGADAVGLNFYDKSPRFVTRERAAQIVRALPPFVEPVGVFVNEPMYRLRETMNELGLRTFQWYGEHPVEKSFPFRAIPAFPLRDQQSLRAISDQLERWTTADKLPAAILVDAHAPGTYGGTGQIVPWELLTDFSPGVPWILAGGLTPDNVGGAIRLVRPYGVDVASGVESSPGKKDADKIRRFIEQAHSVPCGHLR
jgi:phosphoribosylanthranilate isomerase